MKTKVILSIIGTAALALAVPQSARANPAGGHGGGGHAGGGHGGGGHAAGSGFRGAAAGSVRGGFGHTRPAGTPSLGPGVIRHPGSVITPPYQRGVGSPYYGYYGGFGAYGFGLYDYYDPWWGDLGFYGYDGLASVSPEAAGPDEPLGGLRLDVKPQTADVYVDGAIAGTVDDFNGHFQRLKLPAGQHHIELRARGYTPKEFDVYIQPNETMKYHDRMHKS